MINYLGAEAVQSQAHKSAIHKNAATHAPLGCPFILPTTAMYLFHANYISASLEEQTHGMQDSQSHSNTLCTPPSTNT